MRKRYAMSFFNASSFDAGQSAILQWSYIPKYDCAGIQPSCDSALGASLGGHLGRRIQARNPRALLHNG